VTPADVGRRIVCSGCRQALSVNEAGLQLDAEAIIVTEPIRVSDRLRWFRGPVDWPTLLFAVGVILVSWFVMMPTIGSANVDRRTAALGEQTLEHAAFLKKLRDRNADPKQITEAEEAWKTRREMLQDEVKLAEFSRARGAYWDRYGLLLGYLTVAIGAIGWTRADQPLVRRIVGAVILAGQLLLAFQTVSPVGCSPLPRSYNSAANPGP
jgi:hypothetical protein